MFHQFHNRLGVYLIAEVISHVNGKIYKNYTVVLSFKSFAFNFIQIEKLSAIQKFIEFFNNTGCQKNVIT